MLFFQAISPTLPQGEHGPSPYQLALVSEQLMLIAIARLIQPVSLVHG